MNSLRRIMSSTKMKDLKLLVNIDIQDKLVKSVTVIDSHAFVYSLKGGEIVITSFYTIEDKLNIQKSFLKLLKKFGCVAIIIKYTKRFKEVSKEILEYAEKLDLPIYEMPGNMEYSDIISNINELIMSRKLVEITKEEYLSNILYSDLFDESELEKWGKDLGCMVSSGYTSALYIYIEKFAGMLVDSKTGKKNIKYKIENELRRIINTLYTIKDYNKIGMLEHYNGFGIFPAHKSVEENIVFLEKMQKLIIKMFSEKFSHLNVYLGISNVSIGSSGIRDGFKEAEFAINIGRVIDKSKSVFKYSDYEIYDLFYKLHSDLSFSKKTLGEMFGNELMLETLWTFFNNNESLQDTGKVLNIHPNTLKYRLSKIRELTNLDERKINDKFKLYLAVLEYYLFANH